MPELAPCPHCGLQVPAGAFCGSCGAHLTDPGGRRRLHAYAAAPDEHVTHPAVISTLFPHLAHRHAHTFRAAFGGGLVIVLVLAAFRLYTSALIAAAVLLPLLYLLYLYEVEVYQREPVTVITSTLVSGAVLGVAYALLVARIASGTIGGTRQGLLVSGVLLPLIAQAAMVAPPLWLLVRPQFRETLDGLTFGVSSALGFTLADVLTGYWHAFTGPLQGGASTDSVLGLVRAGILVALVNASTTGMITAAVWLEAHGRSRRRNAHPSRGVLATAVVGAAAQIALGLLTYAITGLLLLVVVWTIAAAALLVWLRVILHHALLDEGDEHAAGPPAVCTECHRLVPSMTFCPACGLASSAAPKRHVMLPEALPDAG